jgi:hypothetical protein
VSVPRITYVPHPDATREGELNALASVYRFILDSDCHVKKEGGPVTALNDPKGVQDERVEASIPR